MNKAGAAEYRDPVFVLCNGRSGSTLLRFLLDAHPQLACPPETNLPALCAQLATVWSLIEGAPLSAERGDEPPEIPPAAIAGVRHTVDVMVGSYLRRRGKRRYCDKSLGTAQWAELLQRVYPQARFICLYRHPMDVIASGIEACPWGLRGYGFDPYIASTPGNAILALARFWADNVAATLAVQELFPESCYRLRYEDLVSDPEQAAASLFSFLGERVVPGITATCFSRDRERFGPADYKIWSTSSVTSGSVGRGWSVPASMIPPPVLAAVNELTGKLGYLPVDDTWGTCAPHSDLRADAAPPGPGPDSGPAGGALSARLGDRLREGIAVAGPALAARRDIGAAETFVAVSIPRSREQSTEYWVVDLKQGTVTLADRAAQDSSDWDIVGSGEAWDLILARDLNLSVALRSCQIRYCDDADSGPVAAETRIDLLASLLGVTSW